MKLAQHRKTQKLLTRGIFNSIGARKVFIVSDVLFSSCTQIVNSSEPEQYFFGYKMEFLFPSKTSQKSRSIFKTDLDLWDSLGKVQLVLQQSFIGLMYLFVVILESGKSGLIAE